MSRIFRRGTSNTAESVPNNKLNTDTRREASKNRNRAASDAPSLHSASPHSPERKPPSITGQTQPGPPPMLGRLNSGRSAHAGTRIASPAHQFTSTFDEPASETLDINISSSPVSSAKRGSTSSSAQASMRRQSSNPPSPCSEASHLPREDGKPDQGYLRVQEEAEEDELDFGMERESRRRTKSSPLMKRLGEENPFVLPHQSKIDSASQQYPGVVIGTFAGGADHGSLGFNVGGMGFDGSMDDILDPSAASKNGPRHGSASGQAEANIAPWLSDDPPTGAEAVQSNIERDASPHQQSGQPLHHFSSASALPHPNRRGTADQGNDSVPFMTGRNTSQPSLTATNRVASSSDVSLRECMRSRQGSSESVQTVSASQPLKRPTPPVDEVPPMQYAPGGGRHASVAGGRASRYGSSASSATTGSVEKKKGFLGGFLKRKTGQSVSHGKP